MSYISKAQHEKQVGKAMVSRKSGLTWFVVEKQVASRCYRHLKVSISDNRAEHARDAALEVCTDASSMLGESDYFL